MSAAPASPDFKNWSVTPLACSNLLTTSLLRLKLSCDIIVSVWPALLGALVAAGALVVGGIVAATGALLVAALGAAVAALIATVGAGVVGVVAVVAPPHAASTTIIMARLSIRRGMRFSK